MSSLSTSMRPVASFIFENSSESPVKLCMFSGHYETSEVCSNAMTNPTMYAVRYTNINPLKDAGFECDQVADDYNLCKIGASSANNIKIIAKSKKTRYRDFMNYIKCSGLKVTKMRITDLSTGANPSRDIFNSEIEVSQSAIGSKAGSDFIQLSAHIDPSNYLQSFIEVDLERQNLLLDETTLAFLEVPGSAKFQIDFTLAPTL